MLGEIFGHSNGKDHRLTRIYVFLSTGAARVVGMGAGKARCAVEANTGRCDSWTGLRKTCSGKVVVVEVQVCRKEVSWIFGGKS